jgi:protein-S-isoprenylcysteine O-methyltransferase Ste14
MNMYWLILSVLFWSFIHSLLASLKAKEMARRILGPVSTRFYRLAYNLFAGFSFLPVLILAVYTPDRVLYSIPFPWAALMIFCEILAVIILAIGFMQTSPLEFLGLRQLFHPQPARPEAGNLVTNGFYRYVRHPLYTAGLVLIWLLPVMTVNILSVNLSLTLYIVIGAYFEERKLRHEFGQAYADYQAVTPMLIPFTKGNSRTPISS